MLDSLSVRSLLPKVLSSFAVITSFGLTLNAQLPASAATLTPVDLELSLLVDVSGSIDNKEYALQMSGYRNAFIKLAPQFGSGDFGSVAVNFIQWSGRN